MSKKKMFSREELVALLEREGHSKDKVGHVLATADVALKIADRVIADGYKVNKELLEAAALLHDIGYDRSKYKTEADEVSDVFPEHAVIGARRALEMGYPKIVAEAIQAHEHEFTREEGEELGLRPPAVGEDYGAHSWEAKIVAFADMMVFMVVQLGNPIDPWEDKEAFGKALLPYMTKIYKQKTGRGISMDHPVIKRAIKLQGEMIKYTEREDYPPPWEGIEKIDTNAYFTEERV